jgi:hypothetical protein
MGEKLPDFDHWSREGKMERAEAEAQIDRWKITSI